MSKKYSVINPALPLGRVLQEIVNIAEKLNRDSLANILLEWNGENEEELEYALLEYCRDINLEENTEKQPIKMVKCGGSYFPHYLIQCIIDHGMQINRKWKIGVVIKEVKSFIEYTFEFDTRFEVEAWKKRVLKACNMVVVDDDDN